MMFSSNFCFQANFHKTCSSLVNMSNHGEKQQHLCIQSYGIGLGTLQKEVYTDLLVGVVKEE